METVRHFVGVAPLIPDLVERLHTLKELHERAAQFAGAVAYISDSQDQLCRETKELRSLLTQVWSECFCPQCVLNSPLSHCEIQMSVWLVFS